MHDHSHHHNHTDQSQRNLLIAFVLNVSFALLEFAGSIYTGSVAIAADAVHDLGDSVSLGVAWWLERFSKRPGDEKFSFGYKRFSLLGALITSVVLIVGAILVLVETVPRLWNPQQPDAQGMMVFAVLGIVVNGAAVLRLRGGHSHNERAVMLHLLEDVIGWVAVLVASGAMHFWDVPILDPLLSVLISMFVLYKAVQNLRGIANIFLQAIPESVDLEKVRDRMQGLALVADVHHVHIWSLDGQSHVLTAHVMVGCASLEPAQRQQLRQQINTLAADHAIYHTTIEFECSSDDCSDNLDPPADEIAQ